MEDGCRYSKDVRRETAAPVAKIDVIPDEILELVFLRLPSPLHLVRAACTCRRWRHVIAADGGRLIRSLYGAPSSHVVGHYRVNERWHTAPRVTGSNPVFVPSSSSPWADVLTARNFALDFLPRMEHGDFYWELTDIRGGLLLLLSSLSRPRLVICDPLARRYRVIPPSTWFDGCDFLGIFLLDGEDSGAPISLLNFRVSCALYHSGTIRTCAFSSACGRWTSGGGRHGSTVICRNRYQRALGGYIRFARCGGDGSVAYWTMGESCIILALDKETAELSSSVMQDQREYFKLRNQRHVLKYVYKLPWPPTIQACLSQLP